MPVSAVSGKRVLVVEDNKNCASILLRLLERDGHHVAVAENYVKGLQLVRESQFDVCLLDIVLPDGDGLSLARKLRETRPDAKLVAVTALGMENDLRAMFDAGFHAHVLKPYRIEQIRDHLC